jgi:hypothetical protein
MYDNLNALQGDFKLFLQALWNQLDLPSPTRAQYAIADYLQNGPKRLQIQAFRGVGKSWITGAFVLWTLFKDPEKKIMIISASKERADNMSIFLQKLCISGLLRLLLLFIVSWQSGLIDHLSGRVDTQKTLHHTKD